MEGPKILVRLPNWVGDLVMSLPAFEAILKAWPDRIIYALTRPGLFCLLPDIPNLGGFIPYPKEKGIKKIGLILNTAKALKESRFQKAILFQNAFEAALLCKFGQIKEIIGYNRDLRGIFLSKKIKVLSVKTHQVDYYLNIVRQMGIASPFTKPNLTLRSIEKEKALQFLNSYGVNPKKGIIGLAPGAKYGPAKMWPISNFEEIIKRIVSELPYQVIILGGMGELPRPVSLRHERVLDLMGKTDLSVAKALIALCRAFITNDSGLMHVAYALDVPLVAIFGSTDPDLTGPLGRNSRVVRSFVKCSPCFKPTCINNTYECLNQISTNMVWFELLKLLEENYEETGSFH